MLACVIPWLVPVFFPLDYKLVVEATLCFALSHGLTHKEGLAVVGQLNDFFIFMV